MKPQKTRFEEVWITVADTFFDRLGFSNSYFRKKSKS
jgi:hypothetical protein